MENEAIFASTDWINAGGIALILLGIGMVITEIFLPAFGLFGFAGAAAILIGIVQLHQTGYIEEMPVSAGWLIGAAIVGFMLSILGGIYSWYLYKKRQTTGVEAMIGEPAKILDWDETSGQVFVQGENWQAISDVKINLNKGFYRYRLRLPS